MTDADAIRIAQGLLAENMGMPKVWPRVAKKIDALSRSRGLKESTRVALRTAAQALDATGSGAAATVLREAKEAVRCSTSL